MTLPFETAPTSPKRLDRRGFIGGSDARVITGTDEAALVRLRRDKRGEAEPEDLSGNLIVQIGLVTEALNRHWYERNTGKQSNASSIVGIRCSGGWGATLDGIVAGSGAVFEAKFMLPWSFSEEAAAEKYMAQVQHNMWVTNARLAALSVITGGGKWVEIKISGDPLYQHLLLTAEKKFWRCVENGEPPRLFGVEPPRPRIEAIRIVDMGSSNSWAEFAALFRNTREAFLDHERAKSELKGLMPEDGGDSNRWAFRSSPSNAHVLRYSCGFKLANGGVDTRTIQAYLGHKSIRHTVRDTELAPTRFKSFFRH